MSIDIYTNKYKKIINKNSKNLDKIVDIIFEESRVKIEKEFIEIVDNNIILNLLAVEKFYLKFFLEKINKRLSDEINLTIK